MEIIIVLLILLILGIFYLVLENKNLKITTYQVCQKRVPKEFDGLRIISLTDLHNNCFGRNNKRLLKKISALSPDMICIAGDIITASRPEKNTAGLSFVLSLAKQYPVYYSFGNHEEKWKLWDYYAEAEKEELNHLTNAEQSSLKPYQKRKQKAKITWEEYIKQLKEAGVFILENEEVRIQKGTDIISICGLNLPLSFFYKKIKKMEKPELSVNQIEQMIRTRTDEYQILLAHMPVYFKEYAEYGADLVLSGHIHGGVMILPWVGGVISPQYEIFPKYDYGMFRENSSVMILSRGLGTHTIPVRVFNRPELILIELKTLPEELLVGGRKD